MASRWLTHLPQPQCREIAEWKKGISPISALETHGTDNSLPINWTYPLFSFGGPFVTRRYRTSYGLWLTISVILFLLEWFLPTEVKTKVKPIGYIWVVFLTGDWICAWSDMLIVLILTSTFLAIPAVVVGWILHSFIVVGRDMWHDPGRVARPESSMGVAGAALDVDCRCPYGAEPKSLCVPEE
jgi:hypothetical protein